MTHYSTGSISGVGDAGPLTMIGGIALIGNFIGLFAFTWIALLAFAYAALMLVLSLRATRSAKNAAAADSGSVILMLSCLAALVGGLLVGAFHWVQYHHAAYAVLGLYAVAVVVWLAGRAFTAGWSCLFPALGLAMLLAVLQLGSPPGADDMEQAENWTPVTVTVVDDEGTPVEGATVYLDLVYFWQTAPELGGDREWWSHGTTHGDGTARMALQEDPRFQRLMIRVRREPLMSGFRQPTTIGDSVGYDDAQLDTYLSTPKRPYSFQIVMSRRAHPDAAFLAVELTEPQPAEGAATRNIRLALTTQPQPPADVHDELWEPSSAGDEAVEHCYLMGSEPLVFKLDRGLVGRPLTLHVLEQVHSGGYANSRETYQHLRSLTIDAIPLGGEKTVKALALPGRAAQTAPEQ